MNDKRRSIDFREKLETYFAEFLRRVSTNDGDWTVKGFIDIYKNIYTISLDTKVISKILELMVFPIILQFAETNGYKIVPATHQNHYPDITFIGGARSKKIALDLKSTYRISETEVNGMTLGAFTGYFRDRTSSKNISFAYDDYDKHYILGVIYSRADLQKAIGVLRSQEIKTTGPVRKAMGNYVSNPSTETFDQLTRLLALQAEGKTLGKLKSLIDDCLIDEQKTYSIAGLSKITSVIRDFEFFVQEKWRIASDRPGSGNTKNIGSTKRIDELKQGTGRFTKYPNGRRVFDDYWRNYLTRDMAKAIDSTPPFNDLTSYWNWSSNRGGRS